MNEPYAVSTLRRMYKETGLDTKVINKVKKCMKACSNFYKVIEVEKAWQIAEKKCGVTRQAWDLLLAIFARDDGLPYYIEEERELYKNGTDKLLLIDKAYITVENEDFDPRKFVQSIQNGEEYDGPAMMDEDWDRFFELNHLRQGKEEYVPTNILNYANEQFLQETPQVEAMRHFLLQEVGLDMNSEYVKECAYLARSKNVRVIRERAAKEKLLELHDLICDVKYTPNEGCNIASKNLYRDGYQLKSKHMLRFQELYFDMSNHTRMPANCGYTPEEMHAKTKDMPKGISFGATAVKMLQSGAIDAAMMKRDVMGAASLPMELRISMMKEIDRIIEKRNR